MTEKSKKNKNKVPRRKIDLVVLLIMMLVAAAFLVMLTVVDAFPADIVMTLVGVLFALLVVAAVFLLGKKRWMNNIGIVLALVFVILYGAGVYYMTSTYAMFAKISSTETERVENEQGIDVTQDPFNIYITGIDQWNKTRGLDLERSDVNMIITVSPKSRKIMLTSIPRDAYVPLHRTGTMDKLTHTGIYGVDETLNTVQDWTGIKINYYVKANFDACVDLVDAIGGIDIYNPVEFKSALNGHLYEKGDLHLKGRGALYYARERKAFEGEDQLRVKNQLVVVKAILDKVMTSPALITSYGDIMKVLGDEVETDIPTSDMQALVKMQLADLRAWDIQSQRMSGKYEMEIVASMDPSNKYQVLKVDKDTFDSCLDGIEKTMNPTEEEIAAVENEKRKSALSSFIKSLTGGNKAETEATEESDQ